MSDPQDQPVSNQRGEEVGLLPWIAGGLAVVVTALAVLVAVLPSGAAADAHETAREQAMAAARQAVVDFTSFTASTLERQLRVVDSESVGDFKAQWDANKKALRQRIEQQKISSSATVRASAVSCLAEMCTARAPESTDVATVLVAVDNKIQANSGQSSCVAYMMRLQLLKRAGRWLVADVTPLGPNGQGVCA